MTTTNGARPPTHTAFEGRLKFFMDCYSPLTYETHKRIVDALADVPKLSTISFEDFAMYLALTERIEFDFKGDEADAFDKFRAWWEGRNGHDYVEVWQGFIRLNSSILGQWQRAAGKAVALYVDPVTSPLELLEAEDAKEALREDSPLEQPESLGETAS